MSQSVKTSILIWTGILSICVLALAVRMYNLDRVPAGFFADEASIGFNAWKLLHTGKDEYGVPYPFFFRSFGDYRNPIPIYFNIPAIAVFGLSEFAVRTTAAVAGTLTVLATMLICLYSGLWKDHKRKVLFALTTTVFLTTSPWHIHFSRFGSEYIYFPFLLSFGFAVFLMAIRRPVFFPVSALLFGATIYTYYPAWLVMPLFVGVLVLVYRQSLFQHKSAGILFITIFLFSFLPLLVGIRQGIALTRWTNVAITKEKNASLPVFFLTNYTKHFSPEFLFTKGDIDYPGHFIRRFSSRGAAQLYLFQAPLFILGLVSILKNRKKFHIVVLTLLLLYPLGSSLAATDGGAPLAFRSVIGVLPFQYISAFGVLMLWDIVKSPVIKNLCIVSLFITIMFFFIKYINEYHYEYNNYSSDFWGWQFGARDVMGYFLKHKNEYTDLVLYPEFNAPEIFLSFYDPQRLCIGKCRVGYPDQYDKNKKQLFALPPTVVTDKFKILHTVRYPNNSPAFFIGIFLQ